MGFGNTLLKLDEVLTGLIAGWSMYSTIIVGFAFIYFVVGLAGRNDPDVHPMLLARQAQASAVRQPGESAVYRSPSAPHGMDLNSGLNVRDPGLSKWARGRDGDLRDVWRRVLTGPTDLDGAQTDECGRIMTVMGTEPVVEHDLDDLSRQINIIGKYFKRQKSSRIAIYLPNSVEFLITLFACCFYGHTPILLPYDQSAETIVSMLKASKADSMVASVGTFPFDAVTKQYAGLLHLVWVADGGSKHMDWNEVPKGTGGAVNVSTWQEIIDDNPKVSADIPGVDLNTVPKSVVAFWQKKVGDSGQMVEYTHANLVAGIAAQLSAIPPVRKLSRFDLVLPADSLSTVFTLVATLACLYGNSSLALNSVAGRETDLVAASQGISPSVIIASPSSLLKMHAETSAKLSSIWCQFEHRRQIRTLTEEGVIPSPSLFSLINDAKRPAIGKNLDKLWLILVAEPAGSDAPALSATVLSDLRIFTAARVVYALTAPKVAGAVTQTSFYDYRDAPDAPGGYSHFGPPVNCVEVLLRDPTNQQMTSDLIIGEIIARGPAVVGGEAALEVVGTFRDDHTLAYTS